MDVNVSQDQHISTGLIPKYHYKFQQYHGIFVSKSPCTSHPSITFENISHYEKISPYLLVFVVC